MRFKTMWVSVWAMLTLVGVCLAVYTSGWGAVKTVGTDAINVTMPLRNVSELSVYNSGTNVVFCAVNVGTNTLITYMATTSSVPVPGSMTYTFTSGGDASISQISLATTQGTSQVYLGGF